MRQPFPEKIKMLGKKIKESREARDLTQEEFARRCGISRQAIAKIEQGKTKNMLVSTLWKIAACLKVPARELLEE
jgi:transcriptional regulator with XRE-family HTH domain